MPSGEVRSVRRRGIVIGGVCGLDLDISFSANFSHSRTAGGAVYAFLLEEELKYLCRCIIEIHDFSFDALAIAVMFFSLKDSSH